jgi:outer membrane protein assembly factor BamB
MTKRDTLAAALALAVTCFFPLATCQAAETNMVMDAPAKGPTAAETQPGSTRAYQPPKKHDIPLGHPDFYPSADRPIGWRGDWTGAFPGANCVTKWDAETGENIAWTLNTPDAGFSQPIMVGEKVFIKCQPNLLLCLNVHNGEILWQTAIDHTKSMEPEAAKKAREEITFFHDLRMSHARWFRDCEHLVQCAQKAGLTIDDLMPAAKTSRLRVLTQPVAEGKLGEFLAEAANKAEWDRLLAEQKEHGYSFTTDDHVSEGFPKEIYTRFNQANALYDIWFDCAWEGWCLWDFSAPCSDGEYVYVETVNNAVAAVSVADGSIKWQIWEHMGDEKGERKQETHKGVSTAYAQSPLLYKNILFMNQANHVRAYDKRTGKKLWEYLNPYAALNAVLKTKGDAYYFADALADRVDWTAVLKEHSAKTGKARPTLGSRSAPEATSPVVVEVPLPDGTVLPVIYDGGQILYRLEDGKVLCATLPVSGTGGSPVRAGDLVTGKQNEAGSFMVRLTAKDRDTLAYDWLHYNRTRMKLKSKDPTIKPRSGEGDACFAGTASGIWHDGYWYGDFRAGIRLSGKDGSVDKNGVTRMGGNPSPIIAGTRVYHFAGGDLYKDRLLPLSSIDGVSAAQCFDLETKKTTSIEKGLVDKRLLEDSDYALRNLTTKAGYFMANGSPYAQANRIFMRTKGILYCIGDPKQPFPVPKDCPPQGRVTK